MSPVKNVLIALGVALVIVASGSTVTAQQEHTAPIVIAREAEAVGRAVRIWMKRPIPMPTAPHFKIPSMVASPSGWESETIGVQIR